MAVRSPTTRIGKREPRGRLAIAARTLLRCAPALPTELKSDDLLPVQVFHRTGLLALLFAARRLPEDAVAAQVDFLRRTADPGGGVWPEREWRIAGSLVDGARQMAWYLMAWYLESFSSDTEENTQANEATAAAVLRSLVWGTHAAAGVQPRTELERAIEGDVQTLTALEARGDEADWLHFLASPLWSRGSWETLGATWHEASAAWARRVARSGWYELSSYESVLQGSLDWDALAELFSDDPDHLDEVDLPEEPPRPSTQKPNAVEASGDAAEGPEAVATARPREHIVLCGFASPDAPADMLEHDAPLSTSTRYLFFVDVGPRDASGDGEPTPEGRSAERSDVRLSVVLGAFEGEIAVEGSPVGGVVLTAGGDVEVQAQVNSDRAPESGQPAPPDMPGRLWFLVRTPKKNGSYSLRCNIYARGALVQSRLVTAAVRRTASPKKDSLRTELDYAIVRSLHPSFLAALPAHSASLVLNDGGGERQNHHLRLFAGDDFVHDVALGPDLAALARCAQRALRYVAWGSEDELCDGLDSWRDIDANAESDAAERLGRHLTHLARAGRRIYDDVVGRLPGHTEVADELRERLKAPARLQVAATHLGELIPAALFYDDPITNDGATTLCPDLAAALARGADLSAEPCLRGACPSRDDPSIVCAGGFWGFRHAIGVPITSGHLGLPLHLGCTDRPAVGAAASKALDGWAKHFRDDLAGSLGTLEPHPTRRGTLEMLRAANWHVIYLYCGGGVKKDVPYIKVGRPTESPISAANLRTYDVRWRQPQPLVFLNVCHTDALTPGRAPELLTSLVEETGAAGLIAPEITVREALARPMAAAFFERFINENQAAGDALRGARLDLLSTYNPLGLVYTALVHAALTLRPDLSA